MKHAQQKIMVNGELVPAITCRYCYMSGRLSKLWPLDQMKFIKRGWHCPSCVEDRRRGLARNRARLAQG
jgi:hypothetical protein